MIQDDDAKKFARERLVALRAQRGLDAVRGAASLRQGPRFPTPERAAKAATLLTCVILAGIVALAVLVATLGGSD